MQDLVNGPEWFELRDAMIMWTPLYQPALVRDPRAAVAVYRHPLVGVEPRFTHSDGACSGWKHVDEAERYNRLAKIVVQISCRDKISPLHTLSALRFVSDLQATTLATAIDSLLQEASESEDIMRRLFDRRSWLLDDLRLCFDLVCGCKICESDVRDRILQALNGELGEASEH